MNTIKDDITKASKQIGLTDSQVEVLWQTLQEIQTNKPKFNLSIILLYFGTIITLLSMTWFYTAHLNSEKSLLISIIYGLIFFGIGAYLWCAKKLRISGGLLFSLGIVMIPLIIYSLQTFMNWWPTSAPDDYQGFYYWIRSEWLPMEISTLLIACLVLYFIRFPFITVLIYSVIWFISMDAVFLFFGAQQDFFAHYSIVSISIGTLLNVLGYYLHKKNHMDFAFWSYLFGMLLCWTGLSVWDIQTEWGYFTYFLINSAFVFLSIFFHRKIFLFFGSLGIVYYIGHLAYIFSDSPMFSYVLAAIGFAIIILTTVLLRSRNKTSFSAPVQHNEQGTKVI